MTVKCITSDDKKRIAGYFVAKVNTQCELAKSFKTSERTIHRVLVEAGIATTVPRIKGEAYQVMQLLKKHDIPVDELETYLILAKKQMVDILEGYAQEAFATAGREELEDVPF